MQVNKNIIEELIKEAGLPREVRAKRYKNERRVEITNVEYYDQDNFEVHARVDGNELYETHIKVDNGEIEDISCDCIDYYNTYGVCKHTLATMLEFQDFKIEDKYHTNTTSNKYAGFNQIVKTLYNEELEEIDSEIEVEQKNEGTIKIEPQILLDRYTREMKIEFKIGDKRMYKLKNLSEFYERMINGEYFKYGDKLEFIHKKAMFREEDKELLDFIMKYAEIIRYTNSSANSNYRYYGKALSENSIIIGNTAIDELFEILKNKTIQIEKDYAKQITLFIDENPQMEFILEKSKEDEYKIVANFDIQNVNIL